MYIYIERERDPKGKASEFGHVGNVTKKKYSRFEHFLSLDIQKLPELNNILGRFLGVQSKLLTFGVWKTRVLKMGRLFRGSAFSFHFYEGSVWSVTRHVSPNPSSPPDCARV